MHNSESGCTTMRMRMAEMLGGRPEVQEWEIAVLHRMHTAPRAPAPGSSGAAATPAQVDGRIGTLPDGHAAAARGAARLLQRQHARRPGAAAGP